MAWLTADGAGIALGISALFLLAALLMHRVIRKVLMAPAPAAPEPLLSETVAQPAVAPKELHHV